MSGASPITVWGSQNGVPNHVPITLLPLSIERVLIVTMMGTLQIQREEGPGGRVCLVLMGINIGIKTMVLRKRPAYIGFLHEVGYGRTMPSLGNNPPHVHTSPFMHDTIDTL